MTAKRTATKKPASAKPKRTKKARAESKPKKTSALDAAAKVLGESGEQLTTNDIPGAFRQMHRH